MNLANGAPLTPAFLTVGRSDTAWAGLALPFDLTGLGAPSCSLWHEPFFFFGAATDPAGKATMVLPISPDPILLGARLYASWLNLDGQGNGLGLTTSDYGRLILGL